MPTSRFLVVLAVGLTIAAGCLVLASAFDVPALRVVAVAAIVAVVVAREVWIWRGSGRAWGVTVLALVAVATGAFVVERLSS